MLELQDKRTQCSTPLFLCRDRRPRRSVKRTNNTATTYVTQYSVILRALFLFSPLSSVGEGSPLPQNAQTYGYNLCHTILCHPESEPFKGRTKKQPKDLCRETATTNLDGKIKNVPSKKYRECDSVADPSRSFSVLPLTSLLLRMTFK